MAVIFWLSSQPKPPLAWIADEIDWGDKLGHVVVYAILGALLWRAMRAAGGCWRLVAVVMVVALTYGLSDEIHQLYVPGRSFDLLDMIADGVGAALAAVIMTICLGGRRDVRRTGTGEELRGQGQEKSQSGRDAERD
jgi:hypothetical protein